MQYNATDGRSLVKLGLTRSAAIGDLEDAFEDAQCVEKSKTLPEAQRTQALLL